MHYPKTGYQVLRCWCFMFICLFVFVCVVVVVVVVVVLGRGIYCCGAHAKTEEKIHSGTL